MLRDTAPLPPLHRKGLLLCRYYWFERTIETQVDFSLPRLIAREVEEGLAVDEVQVE